MPQKVDIKPVKPHLLPGFSRVEELGDQAGSYIYWPRGYVRGEDIDPRHGRRVIIDRRKRS